MNAGACRYYGSCSAPLCPLDDTSIENASWFPNEEVCRLANKPEWAKRQNKIAKKLGFDAGMFTVNMLKRNFVIRKGTKGIDPGKGDPHRLEFAWMQQHPEYKQSVKQKENIKKAREQQTA